MLQFGSTIHGDGHVDTSEDGFLAGGWADGVSGMRYVGDDPQGQTTPRLPSSSHHHKFVGGNVNPGLINP